MGTHALAIADTQIEDGVIHHILASAPPAELAETLRLGRTEDLTVRGAIDVARRQDNTVQHTAQHALSRALANAARADTVSARLGSTSCTIDIARPGLADADLHRAEDLANAVVMSDVDVLTSFPSADALAKLDLRKQPNPEKSALGVRVVTIRDFDVTPCGGTHCTRTGQIGSVRIVATEKYKGMLRITFHAGTRTLADARARHHVLAVLAADLTCGTEDLPAAVTKLRDEVKGLRERLLGTRDELCDLLARGVRSELPTTPGPHVVALSRPLDDLATLRALAGKLTEDPRVLALVSSADAGGDVVLVVERGADVKVDCGAFVSTEAKARGGRGGGRPERAEGRFPRGSAVEELAAAARARLSA